MSRSPCYDFLASMGVKAEIQYYEWKNNKQCFQHPNLTHGVKNNPHEGKDKNSGEYLYGITHHCFFTPILSVPLFYFFDVQRVDRL